MCGRYSITTPSEALRRIFGFVEQPNLQARYNVAPTQQVPAVRLGDDSARHLSLLRWGLVPFWAKDLAIGSRMINARAETLAEKPAFRKAFAKRRCLILADGFYEWRKFAGGAKQPYRITLPDGAPFAFAGLWETWRNPADGETVETCTIATTEARGAIAEIHHRMPVILAPESYDTWLAVAEDSEAAAEAMATGPGAELVAHPISTRVNKVTNDDPGIIEPVEEPAAKAASESGAPEKKAGKKPASLPLFE